MFRRRKSIASARLLKVGGAAKSAQLRRVAPSLALAIRVATPRAQIAWFGVAVSGLVALYFASKVHVAKPAAPDLIEPTRHGDTFLLSSSIVNSQIPLELVLDPNYRNRSNIRETYGRDALGALAFPAGFLIVAMLLSWQRRTRRLLRHGRIVTAEVRALERGGGDARVTEVELAFARDDERDTLLTTVRAPTKIGTTEPVIYDPNRHDVATALADLPGAPRLVGERLLPSRLPVLYFFLPTLGLAMVIADTALAVIKLR